MDEGSTVARSLGRSDELARIAAAEPGVISFAGGLPDARLFPTRELGRALQTALSFQTGTALQYGWPEGDEQLRRYVAHQLTDRGARVSKDEVVITSGAQQAILIALSALPRCEVVGVDSLTYPGALDLFRGAHARLTELLRPADAYYTMPSVANPSGRRMTAEERRELLALAKRQGSYVIEDDAYDGTWFDGEPARPLIADDRERVFHVGTFSKTLCPGLRIGWLVAPSGLERRALERKQSQDLQANGLSQALLVEYLKQGHFPEHLRKSRSHYRRKAAALMKSVRRHLPELTFQPPKGGFSLWLESERHVDDEALLARAIELGVSFDPGHRFRAAKSSRLSLRLGFASVPRGDIDEGVKRLARALATC